VPRTNDRVAELLREYADLLTIAAADPFKPRAYEKAARAVSGSSADLAELDLAGIRSIPGVGASIAGKIEAIVGTGSFPELDTLRNEVPSGVLEMTRIPGFGPKKAVTVFRELGIADVDALVAAAQDGRLRALKGFSAKAEENVLAGVRRARASGGRVLLGEASEVAEELLGRLREMKHVRRAAFAGSLRRMRETIGDVDLLVASDRSSEVMEAFVGDPLAARTVAHGETKSSILTDRGLQVDLRVIPLEVWGAAMIYFSGS
jgi:DNA polymerase (family 10)